MLAELVAGKREDVEILVALVQRTQTCVLTGEASLTRNVDDERGLAGELVERNRLSGDRLHLKIVEHRHGPTVPRLGASARARALLGHVLGREAFVLVDETHHGVRVDGFEGPGPRPAERGKAGRELHVPRHEHAHVRPLRDHVGQRSNLVGAVAAVVGEHDAAMLEVVHVGAPVDGARVQPPVGRIRVVRAAMGRVALVADLGCEGDVLAPLAAE